MKVQVVSDLHLEFDSIENITSLIKPSARVLIIAGDLCSEGHKQKMDFVKWASKNWEYIIHVPGNHEYYGEVFPTKPRLDYLAHNYVVADNTEVYLEDYTFICSTLWSYIPPQYSVKIANWLNDFSYIKTLPHGYTLTVAEYNNAHDAAKEFIREEVARHQEGDNVVVITHHLPVWDIVSDKWKTDELTFGFASNMNYDLRDFSGIVKAWIHGHSHNHNETEIENIKLVRNPLGYPDESTRKSFIGDFVIEV